MQFLFFVRNVAISLLGGWKSLLAGIISAVDDFSLTNTIQALQHWWKKCVNHKGDYMEK